MFFFTPLNSGATRNDVEDGVKALPQDMRPGLSGAFGVGIGIYVGLLDVGEIGWMPLSRTC